MINTMQAMHQNELEFGCIETGLNRTKPIFYLDIFLDIIAWSEAISDAV